MTSVKEKLRLSHDALAAAYLRSLGLRVRSLSDSAIDFSFG
jgi:hypothetical protein